MIIHTFLNEGIYCIQNLITNDLYIGSSTNIGNRKTKHESLLKNNKHDNHLLQSAVNQYGIENFKTGVLEYTTENLKEKEQYYLDLLNPIYNITRDVILNTPSLSSRAKMSSTRKRLMDEGIIKKQGCRAIVMKDLEGNFISEYESVMEGARQTGFSKSGIQLILRGKYKQWKGHVFEYKN